MALDERLKRELERAARPADPSGLYEHLIRRRERRRIARKMQSGVLAVAVVVGTALGLAGLFRVFGSGGERAGAGPANGLIAFTNFEPDFAIPEVTAAWYLYTMTPEGSDVTFLGPREVDEALFPAFSPDGQRIAFAGFIAEPEERALYVLDVDTRSLTKILTLDARHQIDDLAWSPDGTRIGMLYTELVPTEPPPEVGARDFEMVSTIWTIAPDGSDLRQVTTVGRESGVSWSPDGTRIAFSRYEPIMPGDEYAANDIFVIDADGTNETPVTHDGVSMSPAWSPDGSSIVFESYDPDEGAGIDLYVMQLDGQARTRITTSPGNEFGAVWSPDGTTIAFGERPFVEGDASTCFVSIVRLDGSGVQRLFGMPDTDGCPGGNGISWAPARAPDGTTEEPTPSVAPTPTSQPGDPQDVGLGLVLCDVTSVPGTFLSAYGEGQSAVVGMVPRPNGSCPRPRGELEVEGIAAIDLTGDGEVDIASDPFTCQQGCHAFAAPDIDGDGNDELLVQNVQFSIVGLKLFEVVPNEDEPALVAVTVAPPGDAPFGFQGFEAGEEPQFWVGGDAFIADAIRCEPREGGRVFISTTGESRPHDSPEARFFATETTFVLEGSTLRVLDVREYETSLDDPSPFVTGGCGADLDPYG